METQKPETEELEVNRALIQAEPTPADYRRSGIVIAVAGLVTVLLGLGFYHGPHGREFVAACFFWAIAVLLVVIGSCEAVFANRGGRPGGPRRKDSRSD